MDTRTEIDHTVNPATTAVVTFGYDARKRLRARSRRPNRRSFGPRRRASHAGPSIVLRPRRTIPRARFYSPE